MEVSNIKYKTCKICNNTFPMTKEYFRFTPKKDKRRGKTYLCYCPYCVNCEPTYRRERKYATRYGITIDQYREIKKSQGNRCKLCGVHEDELKNWNLGRRLVVDHDHKTGKIRGLLCNSCNRGLGLLRDDPELLQKAIRYLKEE